MYANLVQNFYLNYQELTADLIGDLLIFVILLYEFYKMNERCHYLSYNMMYQFNQYFYIIIM